MTLLRWAILSLAVLPFIYYLVATYCAWDFFRRRGKVSSEFAPPVSVLKPMQGADPGAYESLASFCRQDYPDYEILFAVDDERDPAIPLIEKLIHDFPRVPMRLFVAAGIQGLNNKVTKLCRLAREARHEIMVASDADIRVEPDYLRRVVAPFGDPAVGAVTCLYRGMTAGNLWSELEDLNLTSDLMASMLVARKVEGVTFTLGATMAVTRSRLAEIGGFEGLVDCAADDHDLGCRLVARGYRVELAPCVVETLCTSSTAREYFLHHLRWGVVTRHCRPWGYAALLFTRGLPWSIAAAVAAPSRAVAIGFLVAYLIARLSMAFTTGAYGLKDPLLPRKWWLIPLHDAIWLFIWVATLFMNRVSWRGTELNVRQGRFVPVTQPARTEPKQPAKVL